MAKAINLQGQHFGYLLVLERDFQAQKAHAPQRQAWWKCKCEACGKIKSMRGSVIKKSQSCGCVKKQRKPLSEQAKNNIKIAASKRKIDLTGQVFSRLTVLQYADEQHQVYYKGRHRTTWKCQCSCGNICYVTTENLRRGDTPSCGCITRENRRATLKDLTGQRFGHLQVLKFIGTINGNSKYLVKCDCGKEYQIYGNNLTQGNTTSCGCIRESHGQQKIREILSSNNINFISQKTFSDFKFSDTKGIPRFDFYLPEYNVAIELNGRQHYVPVDKFGGELGFKRIRELDIRKYNRCINNGIRIFYFTPPSMKKYITNYFEKVYTSFNELISDIKNI